MSFETLKVTTGDGICRIAFDRPQVGNAINARMIEDFASVLSQCADENGPDDKPVTVVVIEGGEDVRAAFLDFVERHRAVGIQVPVRHEMLTESLRRSGGREQGGGKAGKRGNAEKRHRFPLREVMPRDTCKNRNVLLKHR